MVVEKAQTLSFNLEAAYCECSNGDSNRAHQALELFRCISQEIVAPFVQGLIVEIVLNCTEFSQ